MPRCNRLLDQGLVAHIDAEQLAGLLDDRLDGAVRQAQIALELVNHHVQWCWRRAGERVGWHSFHVGGLWSRTGNSLHTRR